MSTEASDRARSGTYGQPPVRPGPGWAPLAATGVPDLGLRGTLEVLWLTSHALAGNPLGDATLRPQLVYLPPGYSSRPSHTWPVVYALHGATVDATSWLHAPSDTVGPIELIDAAQVHGAHQAIVVFPDAWTSVGGSQYLDSAATGRYQTYLYDDVIPAIESAYRCRTGPSSRGVIGHSSGGFGAWHLAVTRPGVFSSLAMIAADALFEGVALTTVGPAVRRLRQAHQRSFAQMWENRRHADSANHQADQTQPARPWWQSPELSAPRDDDAACLDQYMLAACYAEEGRTEPDLLFDPVTGQIRRDIWERWLQFDPVRNTPANRDALRALEGIHLAAGGADPFLADNGAVALAAALHRAGVGFQLSLDDQGHELHPRLGQAYRAVAADLHAKSSP